MPPEQWGLALPLLSVELSKELSSDVSTTRTCSRAGGFGSILIAFPRGYCYKYQNNY